MTQQKPQIVQADTANEHAYESFEKQNRNKAFVRLGYAGALVLLGVVAFALADTIAQWIYSIQDYLGLTSPNHLFALLLSVALVACGLRAAWRGIGSLQGGNTRRSNMVVIEEYDEHGEWISRHFVQPQVTICQKPLLDHAVEIKEPGIESRMSTIETTE